MNYDARVKYIIHELKNNKQSWLLTESAIFGGKSHVISDKLQEAINWYESANAQVSQVSTFNFSAMCSQFGSVFLGAQLIALVEQPRMCTTTRQRLFKAIVLTTFIFDN